jgi:hypothetical protein
MAKGRQVCAYTKVYATELSGVGKNDACGDMAGKIKKRINTARVYLQSIALTVC